MGPREVLEKDLGNSTENEVKTLLFKSSFTGQLINKRKEGTITEHGPRDVNASFYSDFDQQRNELEYSRSNA